MWIRCTFEGSSWGRRGWRAAGAVVKGVGIAVELLVTAAAGLVKDFAVRLLALGAIEGGRCCLGVVSIPVLGGEVK